ncbi:hypothetical protein KC357_g9082 [Hortaea werneckii]|nr:hypothetical protein KC357_g9082 [Hortaea werneckii]
MNPSFLVALQGAAIGSVVAGATCYDHLIIDTRGTGELRGTSIGFAAIIDQVQKSVPNVGVHDTVYPAGPDVTQATTLVGAYDIEQMIQQGLKHRSIRLYPLPDYSQGKSNCPRSLGRHAILMKAQAIETLLRIGNSYRQPLKQGKRGQDCGNSTADASGALDELGLETSDVWYETGNVRDI